ncbi:hypothetical protein CXB51_003167 [Gossypium anomalum]|uniref:Uncharacterized protein n=1 Tax=Gossypium anomalum TaxID=47600 RepID=A0A8J5ZGS0_9ROSI|nr:hypothetical protein CXB51_003167 [Gossypium anomalum]
MFKTFTKRRASMEEFFQFHSSSTSPDFSPESLFRSPSVETLSGRWDELLLNFNDFEAMVWVGGYGGGLGSVQERRKGRRCHIGYCQTGRVTQGRESLRRCKEATMGKIHRWD